MAVNIKVRNLRDSRLFHGGDTVTGFVELTGPLDIPDAVVKFRSKGCANVEVRSNRRSDDDKQILFQTTSELFRGAILLQEGETRTFPYDFLLPEYTAPSWGDAKITYHQGKDGRFATAPHPIPPSTAFGVDGTWSAHIFYSVYAEVRGQRMLRCQEGHVTVVPSSAQVQHALQQTATAYQARSQGVTYTAPPPPKYRHEKRRSIKTWFGEAFATPPTSLAAVFVFTAWTTTVLHSGQGIPMQIFLHHDASASALPYIPKVHLLHVQYRLNATTYGAGGSTWMPYYEATTTSYEYQINYEHVALAPGQVLDIGFMDVESDTMRMVPFDAAPVAPFTTYNVSRQYNVQIKIAFQCDGRPMKASFNWENVNVVFNEAYPVRPPTQFAAEERTYAGAVGVAAVVAQTALSVLTAL